MREHTINALIRYLPAVSTTSTDTLLGGPPATCGVYLVDAVGTMRSYQVTVYDRAALADVSSSKFESHVYIGRAWHSIHLRIGSWGCCNSRPISLLPLFLSLLAMDMKPISVKDSLIQQVNVVGGDQINNYNCKKKSMNFETVTALAHLLLKQVL